MDQHSFRLERSMSDAKGQGPLQIPVDFERTHDLQVREIFDAIAASVIGAQAGLNWLSADPPNLEEVRRALDGIASDGKRAAEIVIRLRALAKNALKVDAAAAPSTHFPWIVSRDSRYE
jgi:hypothetical protein